jgi:hypothetical protein
MTSLNQRVIETEEGAVHEVDITELPPPQNHDFYQEGPYIKCTCHPHTSKRIPYGKQLTMKDGRLAFTEVSL